MVSKCSSLLSSKSVGPETQKNLLSGDIFRSSELKFGWAIQNFLLKFIEQLNSTEL